MVSRALARRFVDRLMLVALPASLALAGCDVPPDAALEEIQSPLNGLFSYDPDFPCTPAQKGLIQSAVTRARAQLTQGDVDASSLMDVCLRNSITSEMGGYGPEQIRAEAKNLPTIFSCKNLGADFGAEAPLLSSPERITFNTVTLDEQIARLGTNGEAAIASMTALLLHEVAHSHGYEHHDTRVDLAAAGKTDYATTVPNQLQQCSLRLSANPAALTAGFGLSRDALTQEARLAKLGQKTGKPIDETYCTTTRLARAINIRTRSDLGVMTNFSLTCQKAGSTDSNTTSATSDSAGAAATAACAAGQVAVGAVFVERRITDPNTGFVMGSQPISVGIVCNAESDVVAGRRFWGFNSVVGLPQQPNDLILARQCPTSMAIKGFKARTNSAGVNEIELICQFVGTNRAGVSVPVNANLPLAGVNAGSDRRTTIERCAGRGALTGLSSTANGFVTRLGGFCGEIGTFCNASTGVCPDFLLPVSYPMVSNGRWGGTLNEDKCGANQALVGLNFRTDSSGVVAVQGVCAAVDPWSRKQPTSTTVLTQRGGATGTATTRTCALGSFLVGWQIEHSDSKVKGIVPKCRDF